MTRGTSNTNSRGSSQTRRIRRAWLLQQFGDGTKAPCFRCGTFVTDETISVDRITPGVEGGRYVRGNIRPACTPCNSETGSHLGNERKRAKAMGAMPRKSPLRLGALRHADAGTLHIDPVLQRMSVRVVSGTEVVLEGAQARRAIQSLIDAKAVGVRGAITVVGAELLARWTK
jgi:hypothetical protein